MCATCILDYLTLDVCSILQSVNPINGCQKYGCCYTIAIGIVEQTNLTISLIIAKRVYYILK